MPSTAGVIDFFLHPKFGLMTSSVTNPSVIFNPLTGLGNVLTASVGLASSYGIVYAVSLVPPFAGKTNNTFPTFEDTVFRLWVTHTLSSGLVIINQQVESSEQNGIVLWDNLLPSSVVIDVFPNFELTVEWLVGV
jgi:hypothetical protein